MLRWHLELEETSISTHSRGQKAKRDTQGKEASLATLINNKVRLYKASLYRPEPVWEVAIYQQAAFSGPATSTCAWAVVSSRRGDIRQCPA